MKIATNKRCCSATNTINFSCNRSSGTLNIAGVKIINKGLEKCDVNNGRAWRSTGNSIPEARTSDE